MKADISRASFAGYIAWNTGLYTVLALAFVCQLLDIQVEAWAASPDFQESAVEGKSSTQVLFPLQRLVMLPC